MKRGIPLSIRQPNLTVKGLPDFFHFFSKFCYMKFLVDCGSPASPVGYILGAVSTTTDGSTVDVSCDSGYGGIGGTITCQSSGSWSAATGCSG